MITKDHSVPCCSRVTFGGAIKIEFDEAILRGGPNWRASLMREWEGGRGKVLSKRDFPILKDKRFRRCSHQILCSPVLKADSLQDVEVKLVLALLPRELGISEDPSISFLPNFPEYEGWKKFPDTVKKEWLKILVSPVCDGVNDAVSLVIWCVHDLCALVPDLSCVGAGIEEMVHGFNFFSTEHVDRWADKTPFWKVIPSENARMSDKPEEESNFWPVF